MTDAPQPTFGNLEARVIRACGFHQNKCRMDCPRRVVEELGQVAAFDMREAPTQEKGVMTKWLPSFLTRAKR